MQLQHYVWYPERLEEEGRAAELFPLPDKASPKEDFREERATGLRPNPGVPRVPAF
jgi:hypothetical protein